MSAQRAVVSNNSTEGKFCETNLEISDCTFEQTLHVFNRAADSVSQSKIEYLRRFLFPIHQILFFTQCLVIFCVVSPSLFKLSENRNDVNSHSFFCEENTTYLTLLSTCIGYLLLPPKYIEKIAPFETDETDHAIQPNSNLHTHTSKTSFWQFVCCKMEKNYVTFSTQICFVIVLTIVSCHKLAFSEERLSCELNTAFFMVLYCCITFLTPPVYDRKYDGASENKQSRV